MAFDYKKEYKEFYLPPSFFPVHHAEPEKKKLQAIQDAAVQAVQENYQDEPHVEAQVAMLIANQPLTTTTR